MKMNEIDTLIGAVGGVFFGLGCGLIIADLWLGWIYAPAGFGVVLLALHVTKRRVR